MTELIIIIGVLVFLAGLFILINPESIFVFLSRHIKRTKIHIFAVLVRLLIGVLFIIQADHSRYPITIEVLGFLSIAVAVSLAAMGRGKFVRLMEWAIYTMKPFSRIGGILALLFGGFVIHAFS